MLTLFKRSSALFVLLGILIVYLMINTGVFSDEFEIRFTNNKQYYLDVPVLYLTHYVWYPLFDNNNQLVANILKIVYVLLSLYMVSKFFTIYLDRLQAILTAFLFIFFPSHDATTYWLMGQYLTLSFAFYLFSFYLAHTNRLIPAFGFGLIASFICYGSTPLALGLFAIFLLNKNIKKAMVIIVPNVIYISYFIPLNVILRMGSPRIIDAFSLGAFFKRFMLQIITFFDALLGPSICLKVFFAFSQLLPVSIILGAALTLIVCRIRNPVRCDTRCVAGLISTIILSFMMFASTGMYPQMAFNLGDRVTIYGSLLISYLLIALPMPRLIRISIIAILVFSIFGISDHWKSWSAHQNTVMARMENNADLKNYKGQRDIFVSGNQFSRYGPFSHIEFFSEGFSIAFVFRAVFGAWMPVYTINKRLKYVDGYIVDSKYDYKTKVDRYINVYDSERDAFFQVKAEDINAYIETLPDDRRHWVQFVRNRYIKDTVLRLMPRLSYVFGTT